MEAVIPVENDQPGHVWKDDVLIAWDCWAWKRIEHAPRHLDLGFESYRWSWKVIPTHNPVFSP